VDAQGRLTSAINTPIAISAGAITNLTETIGDTVASLLVSGTGVSVVYDDTANTLTINSTSTGTVTSVAASAPTSGFTISGSPITGAGTLVFTLNNDLLGVENISTLGLATRTATNTWTTRTIMGTPLNIGVIDGSGIGGHPTIDLVGTAVTADTYGDAATVPTFTVDGYGRLTDAVDVPISILSSQIVSFSEDVQDILGSAIVAGSGITVTYDDLAGTVTIDGNTLTNEIIDDRVAALLVAGANVTLTYNDVANTLTISAAASSVSGVGVANRIPY